MKYFTQEMHFYFFILLSYLQQVKAQLHQGDSNRMKKCHAWKRFEPMTDGWNANTLPLVHRILERFSKHSTPMELKTPLRPFILYFKQPFRIFIRLEHLCTSIGRFCFNSWVWIIYNFSIFKIWIRYVTVSIIKTNYVVSLLYVSHFFKLVYLLCFFSMTTQSQYAAFYCICILTWQPKKA